jgi:hypothetical protein
MKQQGLSQSQSTSMLYLSGENNDFYSVKFSQRFYGSLAKVKGVRNAINHAFSHLYLFGLIKSWLIPGINDGNLHLFAGDAIRVAGGRKKGETSFESFSFWFCLYVECYLGVFISPNKVLHQLVYGLLFLALCITLSLLFGLLIEVS